METPLPTWPRNSILLVDNDPFFLKAVSDLLVDRGYTVRQASDGLEALEVLWEMHPDVILLDLIMPRVDGVRFCRYLREDPRTADVPVIVFSGLSAPDILQMGEIGADAYVAKGPLPLILNNLLTALEQVEKTGRSRSLGEAIYGYDGFRPRQLVSELLVVKNYHNSLKAILRDGVVEADHMRKIVSVNKAGETLAGRTEREFLSSPLASLFPGAWSAEITEICDQLEKREHPQGISREVSVKGRRIRAKVRKISAPGNYSGFLLILEEM